MWLWVGIVVRGITINVNWQYLVSGSYLPAASWLMRIPPNVGSGKSEWEYSMWSKQQLKFKIKSRPKVLIRQATFETDRKHINLSSWRGWIYLPSPESPWQGLDWGAQRCPGYLTHGEWSLNRDQIRASHNLNTKSPNNTEVLLFCLLLPLKRLDIFCFA